MSISTFTRFHPPLVLRAATAADLMAPCPLAINVRTPITKAAAMMTYYDCPAVPVIDQLERPLGLVTAEACEDWKAFSLRSQPEGWGPCCDLAPVSEILDTRVPIVSADAPARSVVQALVSSGARHVLVTGDQGELVGLIGVHEVLRQLVESETNFDDDEP